MADPERGLWEGPISKQYPDFLKSNRISFAYGLISNEDQTFIPKKLLCFLVISSLSVISRSMSVRNYICGI